MQIFIEFGRKNIRIIELEVASGQDYVRESRYFAFPKKIRFIIQTRLFRRKMHRLHDPRDSRPHGCNVCGLLLGLLLLRLSLPRCCGPARHVVRDGTAYQYMSWYVRDLCMSLRPNELRTSPLQSDAHPNIRENFAQICRCLRLNFPLRESVMLYESSPRSPG